MLRHMLCAGVIASCALGSSACSSTVTDPFPAGAVPIGISDVHRVNLTAMTAPTRVLILDEAGWQQAWESMHPDAVGRPARPAVDFATRALVLAAQGVRPTSGYDITVRSAAVKGDVVHVDVMQRSPGQRCAAGDIVTSPVHVVSIPRVAATAVFHVSEQRSRC